MQDYGFNPLGDGKYELVPSKTIVDKIGLEKFKKDRSKTLPYRDTRNEILGMSWEALEKKRGGKLKD